MAHLASEHLPRLLGLLALRHIEEDAEHDPTSNADIGALTSRRDPPDILVIQDTEIDLVGALDNTGGLERFSDPAGILGMNVGR